MRHTITALLHSTADAATAPPVNRGHMTPRAWAGLWRGMAQGLLALVTRPFRPQTRPAVLQPWQRAAARRRRVFLLLLATSTTISTWLFARACFDGLDARPWYAAAQLAFISLYALLSAWVTSGFVTALMGFYVLLRGDAHALSARAVRHHAIADGVRTAVIMPICHEDVRTVFAGLRATCESIARAGHTARFDVFVLSDSSRPETLCAERAAWEDLRATLAALDGPQVEVYYRVRRRRTHRKAGNVADFCRRWGRNYRYMVVLDADSVMSGDTLASLVKLMEAHPRAGIIQTATQAVGHTTLHARAQQFAARVTGRLFTRGMQYWQLGESHYFGHNAIIRVEPFMRHCALAPIEAGGAFSFMTRGLKGPILSHDFVEAALMRRSGFEVWLVSDLTGSYEQQPPDLLSELQRDRRWCQGNLQNAQLIAEPGIAPVHRVMFATGALAYLSAPLWLAFIALGALLWLTAAPIAPQGAALPALSALYAPHPAGAAPQFNHALHPALELGQLAWLWLWTLALLFLPRVLALASVLMKGEAPHFGGVRCLLQSALAETGLALLQAPVRMAAHTLFVAIALTGFRLEWKSPPREAATLRWRWATARLVPFTLPAPAALLGAAGMGGGASLPLLAWLAPVTLPLLLAAPLAVLTSRVEPGHNFTWMASRAAPRLLQIPEEARPCAVLRRAWRYGGAALA